MRGRGRAFARPELDRRSLKGWIALGLLTALVVVLGACAAPVEDQSSSESAIASTGRWALPTHVLAAGAKVRIDYDDAPKWTTTAACSGQLRSGGRILGKYLMDQYDIISSVGGYACRRNTADTSRMSVHGTGRALDIFIPRATGGGADNGHGDQVANWLVMHAQEIGVQLIIWDRSIWRANGTNAGLYGGPHPHDDHLHVELTNEAAANTTLWFSDTGTVMVDASTGSRPDAGRDASTNTSVDAGAPTPSVDAGTTNTDAGSTTPPTSTPDAGGEPNSPPPSSTGPMTGTPSDGLGSGDEPGETNSLGDSAPTKRRSSSSSSDLAEPQPNAGCSASPVKRSAPSRLLLAGLALAVGLVVRRKRAQRSR